MEMKRMVRSFIVILPTIALLLSLPAQAQNLSALTVWQNRSGSTFSLDTHNSQTGPITGTYINQSTGYSCIGTPYPAVGWYLNGAITWSVIWNNNYQNCNSVTAWSGFYSNNTLTTRWVLSTQTTNIAGDDVFTGVAKKNTMSLKK